TRPHRFVFRTRRPDLRGTSRPEHVFALYRSPRVPHPDVAEWRGHRARTPASASTRRSVAHCVPCSRLSNSLAPDDNGYFGAGMAEHLDESVDAEEMDLPAHQVADPRLADSEEPGGLCLGESARLDELREADHQLRSHPQVISTLRRVPKVTKYI